MKTTDMIRLEGITDYLWVLEKVVPLKKSKYTYKEIADMLKLTPSVIKNVRHRNKDVFDKYSSKEGSIGKETAYVDKEGVLLIALALYKKCQTGEVCYNVIKKLLEEKEEQSKPKQLEMELPVDTQDKKSVELESNVAAMEEVAAMLDNNNNNKIGDDTMKKEFVEVKMDGDQLAKIFATQGEKGAVDFLAKSILESSLNNEDVDAASAKEVAKRAFGNIKNDIVFKESVKNNSICNLDKAREELLTKIREDLKSMSTEDIQNEFRQIRSSKGAILETLDPGITTEIVRAMKEEVDRRLASIEDYAQNSGNETLKSMIGAVKDLVKQAEESEEEEVENTNNHKEMTKEDFMKGVFEAIKQTIEQINSNHEEESEEEETCDCENCSCKCEESDLTEDYEDTVENEEEDMDIDLEEVREHFLTESTLTESIMNRCLALGLDFNKSAVLANTFVCSPNFDLDKKITEMLNEKVKRDEHKKKSMFIAKFYQLQDLNSTTDAQTIELIAKHVATEYGIRIDIKDFKGLGKFVDEVFEKEFDAELYDTMIELTDSVG